MLGATVVELGTPVVVNVAPALTWAPPVAGWLTPTLEAGVAIPCSPLSPIVRQLKDQTVVIFFFFWKERPETLAEKESFL